MRAEDTPFPFYTSNLLSVPHGLFCCAGGTSDAPFASLNLSHSVGDHPDRVRINRERANDALGLRHLIAVKQIHADQILQAEPAHIGTELEGYDAIISTLPGTGVLIQQADCQAVLLWAPQHHVVAAIHCGWRGSVLNIIGKTVRCLSEQYDVPAESLRAVISPSLGPCCAEFINYRTELPTWMHAYQIRPFFFDFWAISRHQLISVGVQPGHIETANMCTCCDQRFFSYRRATKSAQGITGRNGSIIGLPASTAVLSPGPQTRDAAQKVKSQIKGA